MSSMRYQRVEDIECLQVVDAMHHDDTAQIIGEEERQRGFLDKVTCEVIYDPRIPINQRTLCVVVALLLFCILTASIGLVTLGASRVINAERIERNRFGVQLVPDLHALSSGQLSYSRALDMNVTRAAYVDALNKFLDIYVKEQESRSNFNVECAEGHKVKNKWCRFSLRTAFQRDGRGCTRYDGYGFEAGAPCLLFAFKDEIQWRPAVSGNATEIPFKCEIKPNRPSSKPPAALYYPAMKSNSRLGGFPLNKLPSLIVRDSEGGEITDDDGETLYDLPPLIFVKLLLPENPMHYTVTCFIVEGENGAEISNLADFSGRTTFTFDVNVS